MASTMAPGASRWQAGAWARIPVLSVLKRLATLLLVAFIFFACFAFSDTSPYDVVAIPTIVLWLCLGLRQDERPLRQPALTQALGSARSALRRAAPKTRANLDN